VSPEAQRIAIAEACGWKPSPHCPAYGNPPWGVPPTPRHPSRPWEELPDYLTDLNAMAEAEKHLLKVHAQPYIRNLARIAAQEHLENDDCIHQFRYVTATATQRAEAFLRTLNLWTP
jgi:hypothetical protein